MKEGSANHQSSVLNKERWCFFCISLKLFYSRYESRNVQMLSILFYLFFVQKGEFGIYRYIHLSQYNSCSVCKCQMKDLINIQ